jgi:D-hydroxyproline dehydrogenase subunit beta
MPDVVIVGGGIIGATCAWELARRGASVTLLERDELAAGASGRNQGWLVEPDDPRNEPLHEPTLAMFQEAAERAPVPIWIDAEPIGHLQVELPGDEVDPPPGDVELGPSELLRTEPGLAPTVVRGWLADRGGRRVDPKAITVGLALLAAEAGATIRHHLPARALLDQGARVTGVVTDDGIVSADHVVVAAGPWSGELLGSIGVSLPSSSARGWIVRLAPTEPCIRHLVERAGWRGSAFRAGAAAQPTAGSFIEARLDAVGGALLNPHPDGTVLVGSSREPVVGPDPVDPDVVRRQVADAIELIPSLAAAEVRSAWWGLRPMSPDDRPMIGRARDGLIVASGHGSEGVTLAGGTAQLVASIVLDIPSPFDPAPFDPLRF